MTRNIGAPNVHSPMKPSSEIVQYLEKGSGFMARQLHRPGDTAAETTQRHEWASGRGGGPLPTTSMEACGGGVAHAKRRWPTTLPPKATA